MLVVLLGAHAEQSFASCCSINHCLGWSVLPFAPPVTFGWSVLLVTFPLLQQLDCAARLKCLVAEIGSLNFIVHASGRRVLIALTSHPVLV